MECTCKKKCAGTCPKHKIDHENLYTVYFNDGTRKIDAILVYNTKSQSEFRDEFLSNLKEAGLDLEIDIPAPRDSVAFVKVHAPTIILLKYANIYGIPLKFKQHSILPEPNIPYKCLKNILNDPKPDANDTIYKRASETISKRLVSDFTTCERSCIVFCMMEYIRFGPNPFNIGLSQLVQKVVFTDVYPLHDGKYKWPLSKDVPLNDRQLLTKYWSNITNWHKEQPLNTIEKYYGNEIGIYFAWLGLYNKMLIIAALCGVFFFILGIIFVNTSYLPLIEEACGSDINLCPYCKKCRSVPLQYYCKYFTVAYINDNTGSVIFALIMSFWATLFMELWKRTNATLNVRWNIIADCELPHRAEFQTAAKSIRLHKLLQIYEQYIPLPKKMASFGFSILVVILMLIVVLGTIFLVILYECWLKMTRVAKIYITLSSTMLTLILMIVLRRVYVKISILLTNQEIPRTQLEYDKSYMIKMVIFSLANKYGKIFYLAFFKGKFFTYPGDPAMRASSFPMSAEQCDPTGCVYELFALMVVVTLVKPVVSNIWEVLLPMIKIMCKKLKKKTVLVQSNTSWEQDYELNAPSHFRIMDEFEEMVMQYGFVTLLVPAFPLAPLCALINNILEVRIDSNKISKYFRRPIAKIISSANVWFDTIQAMTYLAVITNAVFISFTSSFVPQLFYKHNYKTGLDGYVNFTLSEYKVVDSYWTRANITHCWYPGYRYPPGHENEYEHTYNYFFMLSARLGFAVVFVVFVLGTSGILAYAIPDVPQSIRDLVMYNARLDREMT